jgi:hypothetical protein
LIELTQAGEVMQASAMAGKQVTVSSDHVPLQNGKGVIQFTTPAAEPVDIAIYDDNGNRLSDNMMMSVKGTNTWTWNGTTSNGSSLPDGSYKVAVVAANANGTTSALATSVIGTATGVLSQSNGMQLKLGTLTVPFRRCSRWGTDAQRHLHRKGSGSHPHRGRMTWHLEPLAGVRDVGAVHLQDREILIGVVTDVYIASVRGEGDRFGEGANLYCLDRRHRLALDTQHGDAAVGMVEPRLLQVRSLHVQHRRQVAFGTDRQSLWRITDSDMGNRVRMRTIQIDHRGSVGIAVGGAAVAVVGGEGQLAIR